MAWLAGYTKRKKITITGGASGAQTDFQIKLTVAYDGDMQSDFDDLRFTQADGQTLIDAWLETKTNDVSATVWVEFPTTPANGVDQDYYMYYGNAGAASDWDIGATFIFGMILMVVLRDLLLNLGWLAVLRITTGLRQLGYSLL